MGKNVFSDALPVKLRRIRQRWEFHHTPRHSVNETIFRQLEEPALTTTMRVK